MQAQARPRASGQSGTIGTPCHRCGRAEHVIAGDGPPVCRVCVFAWGHYTAAILRGPAVRETGGAYLRHAGHGVPHLGCQLCQAAQVRATPTFDGWARGPNA
jgi:hypothetical protein